MIATVIISVFCIVLGIISSRAAGASFRTIFLQLTGLMMATMTLALAFSSNLIAWVSIALGIAAIGVTFASILKGERIKA